MRRGVVYTVTPKWAKNPDTGFCMTHWIDQDPKYKGKKSAPTAELIEFLKKKGYDYHAWKLSRAALSPVVKHRLKMKTLHQTGGYIDCIKYALTVLRKKPTKKARKKT